MGKIATSISQQIAKLEERGMILDLSHDKIKDVLLDIGYYRLGFYWQSFGKESLDSDRNHNFKENTKFSTILDLYYMYVDLRHLLIKSINRIEINFRTKLIYYCSNKYKETPTWFVHPKVVSKTFINQFDGYYNFDLKKK